VWGVGEETFFMLGSEIFSLGLLGKYEKSKQFKILIFGGQRPPY